MKNFFLILILFISFPTLAHAEVRRPAMTEEEKNYEKMKVWFETLSTTGDSLDMPNFTSQAKSQKEFISELKLKDKLSAQGRATGSGNGGDELAQNFVKQAVGAFRGCEVDKKIQKYYPEKWQAFNKSFYSIRVMSVPFNLCADDTANCPFATSFAAKNFPELKLILVNAYKWNMMKTEQRLGLAAHEFLGINGIETGTYGISSEIHMYSVVNKTANGIEIITYCKSE